MADMVGASELIEDLLEAPLRATLKELQGDVSDDKYIRKSGAAFTLQIPDKASAIKLRDVWGLVVSEIAPGLLFSHAVSEGESLSEALKNGRSQLLSMRSYVVPRLPVIGPLIIRSPRTGNPAVQLDEVKEKRKEWIDQASKAKRERHFRKGHRLTEKFVENKETLDKFAFPLNLEPDEEDAFPFESGNHYVAIIHIDGNGLGEVLIRLGESLKDDPDSAVKFRSFSENLKDATEKAARTALSSVFTENDKRTNMFPKNKDKKIILPFRPLILGGDDLTVIIRGEYALEFVKFFVETFEIETEQLLNKLDSKSTPAKLTACAGVAFVKVNQPFYLAYQLAESLCGFAKKEARQNKGNGPIPSTVAMHRITSSFISDYETALNEEMTQVGVSGECRRLTLGAYGLGQYAESFPPLNTLLELKELFQIPEMSKGPLRNFLTLLHAEPAEAKKAYKRWLSNLEDKWPIQHQEYLDRIKSLVPNSVEDKAFLFLSEHDKPSKTFIGDLMHLIAVEGEAHDR